MAVRMGIIGVGHQQQETTCQSRSRRQTCRLYGRRRNAGPQKIQTSRTASEPPFRGSNSGITRVTVAPYQGTSARLRRRRTGGEGQNPITGPTWGLRKRRWLRAPHIQLSCAHTHAHTKRTEVHKRTHIHKCTHTHTQLAPSHSS